MTSATMTPLPTFQRVQANGRDSPPVDQSARNPGDHHVVPYVLHGHHPVVPHGDDNDLDTLKTT